MTRVASIGDGNGVIYSVCKEKNFASDKVRTVRCADKVKVCTVSPNYLYAHCLINILTDCIRGTRRNSRLQHTRSIAFEWTPYPTLEAK